MSAAAIGALTLALLGPPPEWEAQREDGNPRVDAGIQGGRHLGFHLKGEWQFAQWHHGEAGVGGLFATHVYFQRDPRRPQAGVDIEGADTSVNLAPTVGHTFRFAKRRLSLATLAYLGMSIRNQHTAVVDPAHDFRQRHDTTRLYADLGVLVSVGVRLGRRLGLNLDGVIPLYVGPDGYGFPRQSTVTSPYVGLSLSVYLGALRSRS